MVTTEQLDLQKFRLAFARGLTASLRSRIAVLSEEHSKSNSEVRRRNIRRRLTDLDSAISGIGGMACSEFDKIVDAAIKESTEG
jgi:hypothetical protein